MRGSRRQWPRRARQRGAVPPRMIRDMAAAVDPAEVNHLDPAHGRVAPSVACRSCSLYGRSAFGHVAQEATRRPEDEHRILAGH